MSTYWRDLARTLPALPAGLDGKPLTGGELSSWEHVQEQAEKERERELQAMATVDVLHRRQETMAWLLETKTNAEREAVAIEQGEPAKETKKRKGPTPNESADSKLLREICSKNPRSAGWREFKSCLTTAAPGRRPVNEETARKRFKKAAKILTKQIPHE